MTPRTIHRIGKIKIKINPRDWTYFVHYPNPQGGKPILESTGHKATTQAQRNGDSIPAPVKKIADARFNQLITGTTPKQKQNRITISQAFTEAIKRSMAGAEHRKNLISSSGYFADWLELNHHEILYWDQITPRIILDYVDAKAESGVGPKTLRHYVSVITMTAAYWARNEPENYREFKIISPHMKVKSKPEKNYLNLEQLQLLLKLCSESKNQSYYYAVLMGGFAGLNIKEVISLKRESFSGEFKTVTISEGKTAYRERSIPLLAFVTENVKGFQPLTRSTGGPAGYDTIGKGLRKLLNKAAILHKEHAQAFLSCDPKDMRKSFANLCVTAKVSRENLGYYIGHARKHMTDRVYAEYESHEYLQSQVLDPIEAMLNTLRSSAD